LVETTVRRSRIALIVSLAAVASAGLAGAADDLPGQADDHAQDRYPPDALA